MRTWIIPYLGRLKLTDLTPAQVRGMLTAVAEAGRADATVARVRGTLSSALRQAQADYGLTRNVAEVTRPPESAAPAFRREILTPGDAKAILAAFEGTRMWPLVAFAIGTGLRQGEQLALHWADVELDRRLLRVRDSLDGKNLVRPKSKKSARTLRISSLALRALEAQRVYIDADCMTGGDAWQDHDLVFPGPAGAIRNGNAVTRGFQRQLERSGLEPIRWHALRRVCSALLQDQGVPITVVRDILGHSSLMVTETYAYVMPATRLRSPPDPPAGPSHRGVYLGRRSCSTHHPLPPVYCGRRWGVTHKPTLDISPSRTASTPPPRRPASRSSTTAAAPRR
jgi:integrase